jgi:hypothetical protein
MTEGFQERQLAIAEEEAEARRRAEKRQERAAEMSGYGELAIGAGTLATAAPKIKKMLAGKEAVKGGTTLGGETALAGETGGLGSKEVLQAEMDLSSGGFYHQNTYGAPGGEYVGTAPTTSPGLGYATGGFLKAAGGGIVGGLAGGWQGRQAAREAEVGKASEMYFSLGTASHAGALIGGTVGGPYGAIVGGIVGFGTAHGTYYDFEPLPFK